MAELSMPKEVGSAIWIVDILGVLPLAIGIVLGGLMPFFAPDATGVRMALIGGAILMAQGAVFLLTARAMRRQRSWARAVAIILGFLCTFGFPVGTVVGVILVVKLLSRDATAWFAGTVSEQGAREIEGAA